MKKLYLILIIGTILLNAYYAGKMLDIAMSGTSLAPYGYLLFPMNAIVAIVGILSIRSIIRNLEL